MGNLACCKVENVKCINKFKYRCLNLFSWQLRRIKKKEKKRDVCDMKKIILKMCFRYFNKFTNHNF